MLPPTARKMLATKSKAAPPPFTGDDKKKAQAGLKRLEQEARDAQMALELQRKQYSKDIESGEDEPKPHPRPLPRGYPEMSTGVPSRTMGAEGPRQRGTRTASGNQIGRRGQ